MDRTGRQRLLEEHWGSNPLGFYSHISPQLALPAWITEWTSRRPLLLLDHYTAENRPGFASNRYPQQQVGLSSLDLLPGSTDRPSSQALSRSSERSICILLRNPTTRCSTAVGPHGVGGGSRSRQLIGQTSTYGD